MPIKINYTPDLYFNQQIYKKCPRNLKLGIEILKKYGKIVFNRGFSSAGQSACFTRRRSRVRAAQSPPVECLDTQTRIGVSSFLWL